MPDSTLGLTVCRHRWVLAAKDLFGRAFYRCADCGEWGGMIHGR